MGSESGHGKDIESVEPRLVQLSNTMSHALRHAPWQYELELDDAGWVPVDVLLTALHDERRRWRTVTEADLAAVLAQSEKRRFEMADGRIRALYGHSVPRRLAKTPAPPPETLYHGTSEHALAAIMAEGLLPMGRQYVHLSADEETARLVAARKPGQSVILTVHAGRAHGSGVAFYRGNEQVWLADAVLPAFIAITPEQTGSMRSW
jgi:putative RNA 2'-phosphotransferase